MERSFIEQARKKHAAMYAEKGDYERAEEIATAQSQYIPLLKPREIHPEEEPVLDEFNSIITDISNDLLIVNNELAIAGDNYKNLLEDTKLRLERVQRDIAIEEERLKDLNMLCGDHSEFDSVETLTAEDFTGKVSESSGVFSARVISEATVRLEVINVQGNGYEGNRFVYKDKRFISDIMDTSDRRNLVDGRLGSVYEYSRINADKDEEARFSLINFDDIEAECSITLRASSPVSMLNVVSDSDTIILKEVSVSDDGATFNPVTEQSIAINNVDDIYINGSYAYGSGLVCFPSSQFIKLIFQSGGHTNEDIAFEYYDAKG